MNILDEEIKGLFPPRPPFDFSDDLIFLLRDFPVAGSLTIFRGRLLFAWLEWVRSEKTVRGCRALGYYI